MKFKDINKKFSEAVAKRLAEGYVICCQTMGGSQGEIAHVNFIKDDEHYSLILEKEHSAGCWSEKAENFLDYLSLRWVKSKELKGDPAGNCDVTFWRGDKYVEILDENRYWIVSDRYRADFFTDSEDEAKKICRTRLEHWRSGNTEEFRSSFTLPMSGNLRKMVAKFYRKHKARWQKTKILAPEIDRVDFRRVGNARTLNIWHEGLQTEVNF